MKSIRIFTDGACSCNPGPGGWAAIFLHQTDTKVLKGHASDTTNNRMELTAVIRSLRKIVNNEYDEVTEFKILSDSAYVINAINGGWANGWVRKGWKTVKGTPVKNADLWKEFLTLTKRVNANRMVIVKYIKVKGHSGDMFNEMADQIAVEQSMLAKAKK